jgi:hypothetical protein
VGPTQGEQAFVFDDPLDGFPAGEVHGLGEGRREVDVPLFTGLAFDELDLGRERHSQGALLCNLVISLDITEPAKLQQTLMEMFLSSEGPKSRGQFPELLMGAKVRRF